jgi:hypothetical protein
VSRVEALEAFDEMCRRAADVPEMSLEEITRKLGMPEQTKMWEGVLYESVYCNARKNDGYI